MKWLFAALPLVVMCGCHSADVDGTVSEDFPTVERWWR